jgi:hypothetical protein
VLPVSTFDQKQPLSTSLSCPVARVDGGNKNRFKYDSLPKEIIEKNFGTETK